MGGLISDKRLLEIKQLRDELGTDKAAKQLGLSESTILSYLNKYKKRQEPNYDKGSEKQKPFNLQPRDVEFKEHDGSADVVGQARSLDELLAFACVDLDVWEVDTYEIKQNSWDVHMKNKHNDLSWKDGTVNGFSKQNGALKKTNRQYYIKARLKRRTDYTATSKFRLQMIEEFKQYSPTIHKLEYKEVESGNLLEINIPDLHLGKLSWAEETGFRNYDVKIAKERFTMAFNEMFAEAVKTCKFEKILFIIGNDLFNSDTAYPITATTAGTPQQDDIRWQKVFREGRQMIIDTIMTLSQVAPVIVKVVPGNHDFQKSFYLGDVLEAYFYKNENITIDNSPKTRKYFKWGKCLLGFAHGSRKDEGESRLLNNMKHECAVEWGDTFYREWHCGDIHHYKELVQRQKNLSKFIDDIDSGNIDRYAEDIDGVVIKYLRTLMFNDEWEAKKGYISQKGAHMFVWHKENGNTHEFKFNRYE